jgi:glycosyltransferase involved in cell wall biosynthesis
MSSKPLLSICIPTYNRALLLAQTLAHVRSVCWGDDVEVVISDNCSTDDTQEVIARFAAQFRHFRAIRQAENRGGIPNIGAAIALASGEFTYTLNDDDELFIEGLGTAIAVMKGDERIVAVYGAYQVVSGVQNAGAAAVLYLRRQVIRILGTRRFLVGTWVDLPDSGFIL